MGEKPQMLLFGEDRGDTVVFVEDVISAIKVGRQYVASPVLGSHISDLTLLEAAGHFENVGLWLDSNMIRKSARIAQKAGFLTGSNVFRVYTPLDPKYYNNIEINMIVEEAKNGRGYCGKVA